jgi:hypothetical protein
MSVPKSHRIKEKESNVLTRYCFRLCFPLFFTLLSTTALSEPSDMTVDEIINQIRLHATVLTSYTGNYTYTEHRSYVEGLWDELEVETPGTFRVDRNTGRFRDDRNKGYSRNITLKTWLFHNIKEGCSKEMDISWLDTPEGSTAPAEGMLYKPFKGKTGKYARYNSFGIEKYFSKIDGWPLDQYLEQVRDKITDVLKIDDYRYTIVCRGNDKETVGFSQEYTVDTRWGWNLTHVRGIAPSGKLNLEYMIDYELLDDVPFLKSAHIRQYLDPNEPSKISREIKLSVDTSSVKINPVLTEDAFSIEFPPGTQVHDYVRGVHYRIPQYTESEYVLSTEPAVEMLADADTYDTRKADANSLRLSDVNATQNQALDVGNISHSSNRRAAMLPWYCLAGGLVLGAGLVVSHYGRARRKD